MARTRASCSPTPRNVLGQNRRALPRERTPELVGSDVEVARVDRGAKPVRQVLLHVGQRCDDFARPRHRRTRPAAHVCGVDRTQVLTAWMATMLSFSRAWSACG